MNMKWIIGIVAVLAVGAGVLMYRTTNAPTPLDPFAACLADKGVVMYGTSWCPYCKQQKELFGRAFRKAAYVECSMPGNPRAQAPKCKEQGIMGYPTWIFGDGTRETNVLPLAQLAEKTGCALPVGQQ